MHKTILTGRGLTEAEMRALTSKLTSGFTRCDLVGKRTRDERLSDDLWQVRNEVAELLFDLGTGAL